MRQTTERSEKALFKETNNINKALAKASAFQLIAIPSTVIEKYGCVCSFVLSVSAENRRLPYCILLILFSLLRC